MKPDETNNEELSELEIAINNRKRKTFEFDVPDVLGHNKKPLGKIRMRAATLLEQEKSITEAHAYAAKLGTSSSDEDSFGNIKTVHILHKVCLKMNSDMVCFPGPGYMLEKLGREEVAILLNNYNEMTRVISQIDCGFDTETLKAFSELCAAHGSTDAPNIFLQNLSRDQVAEIAIRIGILYHELSKEV
jgi:hypothetical protein